MNVLFWNMAKRLNPKILSGLCESIQPDILFLTEVSNNDLQKFQTSLVGNQKLISYYVAPVGVGRLKTISRLPPSNISSLYDDDYFSLKSVKSIFGITFNMMSVHLPSKLHQKSFDQHFSAREVRAAIEAVEKSEGHDRTIVIGDFNMDPFEVGMMAADGFHAIADRVIATKKSRQYKKKPYSFFYNPVWALLGDFHQPPGSFYYPKGGLHISFWHLFDQVIMRGSVLPYFNNEIELITSIDGTNLLKSNGTIDRSISDHLPLRVNFKTDRISP